MLSFNVISKVNPRDLEAPRKFYAVKQPQGVVSVRELAERISRESMLGIVETTAVIEGLLQAVPMLLLEGKIVKLGEFGSYRVSISSTGTESPEVFNSSLIKSPKIIFRPGRVFADKLKTIKYSRTHNS